MANPSIKGSSIQSLVEDLAKLRDNGRLPPELLEERLSPEDREMLDRPVNVAVWYDIHSYRRMAELICEVEGRREDLLRERGAAAARRLAAAGLYQQMESVTRMHEYLELDDEARFKAYGQGLKLIATLSGSILNFATFEVVVDPDHPDRYCMEVHNFEEIPDVLAHTSEGFINAMAEAGAVGTPNAGPAWSLERGPGYMRFRMNRAI
jgi:hypothetical protein